MLLYSIGTACLLTLLASLFHFIDPPLIFDHLIIWRSMIISFLNVLILTYLELLIIDGDCPFFLIYNKIDEYSFQWLFLSSCFYVIITDFLLWLTHYSLHNQLLYSWVHSYHHQVNFPTAFDFAAVHPIESLINWLILHSISIFFPIHCGTILLYGFIMSIFPILEHGRGLHQFPFKLIYYSDFHNIHHRSKIYNYGVGPLAPIWDHLLCTSSTYKI